MPGPRRPLIIVQGITSFDRLLGSLIRLLEPHRRVFIFKYGFSNAMFGFAGRFRSSLENTELQRILLSEAATDLIAHRFGAQIVGRGFRRSRLLNSFRIRRLILVDPVISFGDLRYLESRADSVQILGLWERPLVSKVTAVIHGAASVLAIAPPISSRVQHLRKSYERDFHPLISDWSKLGSDLRHIMSESAFTTEDRFAVVQELAKIKLQTERAGMTRAAGLLDGLQRILEPAISLSPSQRGLLNE